MLGLIAIEHELAAIKLVYDNALKELLGMGNTHHYKPLHEVQTYQTQHFVMQKLLKIIEISINQIVLILIPFEKLHFNKM